MAHFYTISKKAKNHDDVLIPLIEKEAQYFQGIYILFGYDLQGYYIKRCWKVSENLWKGKVTN